MNKKVHYYISKRNFFTWLAALFLLASVVARFVNIRLEMPTGVSLWCLYILPIVSGIHLLIIMLFEGEEYLYKSSIPVFFMAVYYGLKITLTGNWGIMAKVLAWIAFLGIAYIYAKIVSGVERKGVLVVLSLILSAVLIYTNRLRFIPGNEVYLLPNLPDILMMTGSFFATLAMGIHLDNRFHPTWGDRCDGRRLRTLDPMAQIVPYIMPTRIGASNFISDRVEVTEIEEYIFQKRKEGYKGFGITHLFLAAYVRCVAKYPAINRFMSGMRVYSRGDDIQFCMVVKTAMTIDSPDSVIKIHLHPGDTVYDIYNKLGEAIEGVKNKEREGSDFDKTMAFFCLLPRPVFTIAVALLKLLDYYGLMPRFILEVSPFHSSVFFTSMASLGIEPIVHHLYDFGNMPCFCSFGSKYYEYEPDPNPLLGVHKRRYVDYTFNTDERVCDGFYYAQVLKYLKTLLKHPERLEIPPEEIIRDID